MSDSEKPDSKSPPERTVEKVDPALLEEALDVVRGAVRGNGVRPEDVTLAGFEGEVLHFEAFEKFRVEPKVSEKLVHGRERGEQRVHGRLPVGPRALHAGYAGTHHPELAEHLGERPTQFRWALQQEQVPEADQRQSQGKSTQQTGHNSRSRWCRSG